MIKNQDYIYPHVIQRILNLQQQVASKINLDDYILDVALTDVAEYVIELDPFDKSTGSCLYSWTHDYDILTGKTPTSIQLKVREMPLSDSESDNVLDVIYNEYCEFRDTASLKI